MARLKSLLPSSPHLPTCLSLHLRPFLPSHAAVERGEVVGMPEPELPELTEQQPTRLPRPQPPAQADEDMARVGQLAKPYISQRWGSAPRVHVSAYNLCVTRNIYNSCRDSHARPPTRTTSGDSVLSGCALRAIAMEIKALYSINCKVTRRPTGQVYSCLKFRFSHVQTKSPTSDVASTRSRRCSCYFTLRP